MWIVNVKAAQSELNESNHPNSKHTNARMNESRHVTFLNVNIDYYIIVLLRDPLFMTT